MINFISNLPRDLRSGGFSALNATAFGAVARRYAAHYVGPLDPPPYATERVLSRAWRAARLPSNFFFFSERRLDAIAREYHAQCSGDSVIDCFHGFTPWSHITPERPYLAWSDCAFHDYIDVYHERALFGATDLARIESAEAAWLKKARRVLFTSRWAAKRTAQRYGLDPARVAVVGIFGEVDLPEHDRYRGGKDFLFASTNFIAKGGLVVLQAFRTVRRAHGDARLIMVGDTDGAAAEPGVEFTGFLRKEDPIQYAKFRDILGTARAIVHPTKQDISPHLIVEAGYHGCPAISSRRYAIPELVEDGRTGLLLDDPDAAAVAAAMMRMLESEDAYRAMRNAAWEKSRRDHTKARFEASLIGYLEETMAG